MEARGSRQFVDVIDQAMDRICRRRELMCKGCSTTVSVDPETGICPHCKAWADAALSVEKMRLEGAI